MPKRYYYSRFGIVPVVRWPDFEAALFLIVSLHFLYCLFSNAEQMDEEEFRPVSIVLHK